MPSEADPTGTRDGVRVSITEHLDYPTNAEYWVTPLIIGVGLSLVSVLFVPAILIYGYVVRVLASSVAGQSEPPTFDDWTELFRDGLTAFLIGSIYMAIPAVVAYVTLGEPVRVVIETARPAAQAGPIGFFSGFQLATVLFVFLPVVEMFVAVGIVTMVLLSGSEAAVTAAVGALDGVLITLTLSVLFGYVTSAAITNFAKEKRFRAGFDVGTIGSVVLDPRYLRPWLVGFAVLVVGGTFSGLVSICPGFGYFMSAFVFFYTQVVVARYWADGYRNARGLETYEHENGARSA